MSDVPIDCYPNARGASNFVETFFRHKKKAVVVPLAILALAMLVILFAPRKYRSEAKLFLQIGRESVNLDPTATTGDTISLQANDRVPEIKTAVDLLQSRGLIEKVVERLSAEVVLGRSGPGVAKRNAVADAVRGAIGEVVSLVKSLDPISDNEEAAILIERHLWVEAERKSTVIAVRFDAETPQLAQLVAGTLIEVYREEHMRLHHTSGSKEFFAEQFESLRGQLDQAVDRLRLAKNRLNIVSIESRRQTLESRLGTVELARYQASQQLAATKARTGNLKKQIAAIPTRMTAEQITLPDTGTDSLRVQIYELRVQMLDQQTKYSNDHPFLKATREQLADAEAMLKAESSDRQTTTDNVNPNHTALALELARSESQLAGLIAQEDQLAQQRATVLADLKRLNDNELEIDQLTRESQLARTDFFRYAENLEKARIDNALNHKRISNAIVAQRATLAEKPVSPNKLLIGTLALVLAAASSVAVVLLSESMTDRIASRDQLEEALQMPVFGVLPNKKSFAKVIA